jgi:regulator of cell morphogenesis and NO signaling
MTQVLRLSTQVEAGEAPQQWSAVPLEQLIDHLMDDHRRWLEELLPSLAALLEQRAREEKSDSTFALRRIFRRLSTQLEAHLRDEEHVLFPAILEMDRGTRNSEPRPKLAFGSVRNPITMIEREHEDDAQVWDTIRHLALLDAVAEGATKAAKRLYQDLTLFEDEVRTHTAVENTVLFPRAVQLEQC